MAEPGFLETSNGSGKASDWVAVERTVEDGGILIVEHLNCFGARFCDTGMLKTVIRNFGNIGIDAKSSILGCTS